MYPKGRRSQTGFLMPLAIFIVVTMAGLALAMARTTSQSNSSVVQTMIGIQTFYAADAGAQWGMNQLFYSTTATLTRASVDANCVALTGQLRSFNTVGLRNCEAVLACSVNADPGNTTSYYLISSDATCGDGAFASQRRVEVSAFMR